MKKLYVEPIGEYEQAQVEVVRVCSGACVVDQLYVPPRYRGLGIGRLLMNRVIQDADDEYEILIVHIVPFGVISMTTEALRDWYERLDFRLEGEVFQRQPGGVVDDDVEVGIEEEEYDDYERD